MVGSSAVKKDVPNHPWTQDLLWLQSKSREAEIQRTRELILPGFVPDEDLPYFYNLATIYCQPSFAEGFGLPLVQAMKSGCPVAYSQDSCLDEIMDSNGLKFNPHSQKDLEKSLVQFWNDNDLRQKYIKLGLIHAKNFDWKYTAIQTLALYNLILKDEK
ncbi:MAG: glycosyltransferase [Candidatus Shapirobacteria bacterium]|nr:glycosyltransferase [Candidatus Shapirobacteria bacterium]